jgi:hypothetical protein
MQTQTINSVKVKPIPKDKCVEELPVKGGELFGVTNSTAMIIAKRNSGKTVLLFNIIKKTADKNTFIYFFVSTIFNDSSYDKILEYCDSKGINYEIHTEIRDKKIDNLHNVIEHISEQKEAEKALKDESSEDEAEIVCFGDKEYKKKKKPKKKVRTPKFMCILDDIGSTDLKSASVNRLFKTGRHMDIFTYVSTQYTLDISPGQWQNTEFILLFAGINLEKLKKAYNSMPLSITYEELIKLYQDATGNADHSFLYINSKTGEVRKNFNQRYLF